MQIIYIHVHVHVHVRTYTWTCSCILLCWSVRETTNHCYDFSVKNSHTSWHPSVTSLQAVHSLGVCGSQCGSDSASCHGEATPTCRAAVLCEAIECVVTSRAKTAVSWSVLPREAPVMTSPRLSVQCLVSHAACKKCWPHKRNQIVRVGMRVQYVYNIYIYIHIGDLSPCIRNHTNDVQHCFWMFVLELLT